MYMSPRAQPCVMKQLSQTEGINQEPERQTSLLLFIFPNGLRWLAELSWASSGRQNVRTDSIYSRGPPDGSVTQVLT